MVISIVISEPYNSLILTEFGITTYFFKLENSSHISEISLHNHDHGVLLSKIQGLFGGIQCKFVHAKSLNTSMEVWN
jgi:hypothetical protein